MKSKASPVFMMVGDEQFSLSTCTDNLARPAIETPSGVVRLETLIHGSVPIFDRAAPTARTKRLLCKVPDEPDVKDCRAALGRIRAQNEPLTITV